MNSDIDTVSSDMDSLNLNDWISPVQSLPSEIETDLVSKNDSRFCASGLECPQFEPSHKMWTLERSKENSHQSRRHRMNIPSSLSCALYSNDCFEMEKLGASWGTASAVFGESGNHRTTTRSCLKRGSSQESIDIQRNNGFSRFYSQEAHPKKVFFSTVEIRRYPMTLGDNPACRTGPPVSLDWEYEVLPVYNVIDFDKMRRMQRRKGGDRLRLSHISRLEILAKSGVSRKERKRVERKMSHIRRQRSLTTTMQPLVDPIEQMVETTSRKFQKLFRRKNAVRPPELGVWLASTKKDCSACYMGKRKMGLWGFESIKRRKQS